LRGIAFEARPNHRSPLKPLRRAIVEEWNRHAEDQGFPVKPQKIVWDLRQVLAPDDIVICDVGAHKMWTGRMYQTARPNTCIISNGFASMGIAVPGAVAAKLAYPERKVVAVTGDAGFMMNSQEIETALRVGAPFVILIWSDSEYGLITWHQLRHFGRPSHVAFKNPDFVKYAESFGARGYRVEKTADLIPTLKTALEQNTVAVVDCPVDYSENMKLTQWQKELKSPL
jgi:acetolactate synthase I/II/III large subunit